MTHASSRLPEGDLDLPGERDLDLHGERDLDLHGERDLDLLRCGMFTVEVSYSGLRSPTKKG